VFHGNGSGFVFLEVGFFDLVLLWVERQAEGLFDDVGGEGYVGGDLGDLAANECTALP
jgi:hypothetical protein